MRETSMKIIYTEHAEEKIAERNLSKTMIEDSLIRPDEILEAPFGRKIAQKLLNDKLLRIVYSIEDNTIIIITVYFAEPKRYGVKI